MAHDSNDHKQHGVGSYVVVALILGVITYIEFAIIEFEIAWLGDSATLWWLMILSVAKFIMVILYFMHLKDDDFTYSGFFASGMVIGVGTFIAFAFLMTAPSSLDFVRAQLAPDAVYLHGEDKADDGHGGDDHGLPEATQALIASDGYSRELDAVLGDGRPKDASFRVVPPAAASDGWTLASTAPMGVPTEAPPASTPGAQVAVDWNADLGEQVFTANCASCHQATGVGIPGAFPPLAGHTPELVAPEGGRAYLVNALLYGLQGPIEVAGASYNGVMPAWAFLSDEQIAAIANYALFSWGNDVDLATDFVPISADEVASERGKGWTGADVHDLRESIGLP